MGKTLDHSFDFCQFQRFVNNVGGIGEYPAFSTEPIRVGDRLTQYGFSSVGPPPSRPGVYVVCCYSIWYRHGAEHLLYIGSSVNMFRRVMNINHPYRIAYDRTGAAYTRYLVIDDFRNAERSLIRTLRPLLNIQHNGKKIY